MPSKQISDHEFRRRWALLRSVMDERSLDCIVVQATQDFLGGYFRWVTGAAAYFGYPKTALFFRDRGTIVIEHGARGAERLSTGDDIIRHGGVERTLYSPGYASVSYTWGYDTSLAMREIQSAGVKRLGIITGGSGYHGFYSALLEEAASIECIDITGALDRLKWSKSAEELEFVRATAKLQDDVISELAGVIRPGMRDFQVAAKARQIAEHLGSEQGVYLCSSARPGAPAPFKARPEQDRMIEAGDTFTILVETNGLAGFYTEIGRSFVLGSASPEMKATFGRAISAQDYALSLLKPGAVCSEIFSKFNAYLRARNLPEERRLFCHGQGHDLVERPLIRDDDDATIEEGMSIVVHPGFVVDGVFAHVCDNYIIGPDGPGACLHKTPKQIIEI